jgi:hypothetical protein
MDIVPFSATIAIQLKIKNEELKMLSACYTSMPVPK